MNNKIVFDILDSVHTIIAGVTGSGKSVLLNNIIYTIITNYDGKKCRLILCDPKRIEFAKYKNLPHVLHYGNDNYSILSALRSAHKLMEDRYKIAEDDVWNDPDFTPVYIIIDELADVLLNGGKEVKTLLQSIAQKGRSANIHMIVATQHPSKQQFPSFIQDNFNTKIALHCDTPIQSRQILGTTGAENLSIGNAIVARVGRKPYYSHIPMIEKTEIRRVVEMIVNECKPKETAVKSSESVSAPVQQITQHPFKKAVFAVLNVLKCLALIPILVIWKTWEDA